MQRAAKALSTWVWRRLVLGAPHSWVWEDCYIGKGRGKCLIFFPSIVITGKMIHDAKQYERNKVRLLSRLPRVTVPRFSLAVRYLRVPYPVMVLS
jgi:hypothetical protein